MPKFEIFDILRGFSKEEITRFRKFLCSPYFGEKKAIYLLYLELVKYHPLYTDINISVKNLSRKLYRGKKYKETSIRNLISDLHESALRFLQQENFERSVLYKTNFLFNEMKIRNLNREFSKVISKIEYFNDELVDWSYFLNYHFIETYKFNFSYHNSRLKGENMLREQVSMIQKSINFLVYFFVTELVSHYLGFIIYKKTYNLSKINSNIDKLMDLIDFAKIKQTINDDKYSFILDLYSSLLELYIEFSKDEKYYAYKNMLMSKLNLLSKDEIHFHYHQLIGYCTLKLVSNNDKFEKEQLILYRELLDNNYYLNRNTSHLPKELFRNMLFRAFSLKEYTWAEYLIKNYSMKVHPNDRQNIYNYGNAYLNYNLGRYDSSLNFINKIKQDYFVFKIDVKNLHLMIYYELDYTEEGLQLIKSYKDYIKRNKLLTTDRQNRYLNFARFLEKIIICKYNMQKKDAGFLKYKLMQSNNTAFKYWHLEKISALNKSFKKTG